MLPFSFSQTKSEFFECGFGPLSSHPFSLIFPPLSPSGHIHSPTTSPLFTSPFIHPSLTPGKLRFRYPSDLDSLVSCRLLGSENGSRCRSVSQLQSYQSRCTVQRSPRGQPLSLGSLTPSDDSPKGSHFNFKTLLAQGATGLSNESPRKH